MFSWFRIFGSRLLYDELRVQPMESLAISDSISNSAAVVNTETYTEQEVNGELKQHEASKHQQEQ